MRRKDLEDGHHLGAGLYLIDGEAGDPMGIVKGGPFPATEEGTLMAIQHGERILKATGGRPMWITEVQPVMLDITPNMVPAIVPSFVVPLTPKIDPVVMRPPATPIGPPADEPAPEPADEPAAEPAPELADVADVPAGPWTRAPGIEWA